MPKPTRQTTEARFVLSQRWVFCLVTAVVGVLAWQRVPPDLDWTFHVATGEAGEQHDDGGSADAARATKRFLPNGDQASVHASSLVSLPDGSLLAFWFGGSKEGNRDVTIRCSRFDPVNGTWSPDRMVLTTVLTQQGQRRYTKSLGNPVAFLDGNQTLWVFYVSVSLGGWSGSSANFVTSKDFGRTWSAPRKILAAPFFNLCTQLKAAPFLYADGTIGLPVHHEMGLKFCSILRLDQDGKVLAKQRLTQGWSTLQPLPLIIDHSSALVLMRYASDSPPFASPITSTTNGGRNWTPAKPSSIPNPNSALAGLTLPDGRLLVACNDQTSVRNRLSLLVSEDHGKSWEHIYHVEQEPAFKQERMNAGDYREWLRGLLQEPLAEPVIDPEPLIERVMEESHQQAFHAPKFEYPSLTQEGEEFHLTYTWNRVRIRHFQFNQAWLEDQLTNPKR
ncbi:MAG: sialidase family protein [Terrimicrobiaceae bacterium]